MPSTINAAAATDRPWKCGLCNGTGRIMTGGCSMEHGISTSCEDFGCLPIGEMVCPTCDGDGYLVMPPTLKGWIDHGHSIHHSLSRGDSKQKLDLEFRLTRDSRTDGYWLTMYARGGGPHVKNLLLRHIKDFSVEGTATVTYLNESMTVTASIEILNLRSGFADHHGHDLTISVKNSSGEEVWACRIGVWD